MRVLPHDQFMKRGARRRGGRLSGTPVFVLALLSCALLVLSRLDNPAVQGVRSTLTELIAPALHVVTVPLEQLRRGGRLVTDYMALQGELTQLRTENQRLRGWEARARELDRRLSQLNAIARVVEEPALAFITTRVVADASGPFLRTALIYAGREQGLKAGNPAINGDGVVGRVLEAGRTASRLVLLTDLNSRIPVLVGQAGIRAVLTGDNSSQPRLTHVPADAMPEAGEDVVTSGAGGLFPRGLRVGLLVQDGVGFRVQLHANLDEIELVSVLLFDSPTLELTEDVSLGRPPGSRRALAGRAGDPADR